MKKNPSFLIVILFFLIIAACDKKNTSLKMVQARDTISVAPSKTTETLPYSRIFEKIEYIPIQTDEEFLIGSIDKLLVTDNYLFILDRKITRSVFAVDRKGNKVFHLNKTGQGPGEYILINDIVYDEEKNELLVGCKIRKCLLHYDMSGNFLYEEKIPYDIVKIQLLKDKLASYSEYYGNDELTRNGLCPNILLMDNENKSVISEANFFNPPVNQGIVWTSSCNFSVFNDTLSIKPDHCNTVYHITEDEIYPAYDIDFGQYGIDERYWNKIKERGATLESVREFGNNQKLCESFWFSESSKYLFFAYRQRNIVSRVLYLKESKRLIHPEGYVNDMDLVSYFKPVAIHRDKFYCIIKAEDVHAIKEEIPDVIFPAKELNEIEEFSNPIIGVFTVKREINP
jgi:hypothetical protein